MSIMEKIERFGYLMREMGIWEEMERRVTNADTGKAYANRAERYRRSAKELKTDIQVELDKADESSKTAYQDRNDKAYKVYEQYNSGKMTASEAMDEIIAIIALDPNV